MRGAWSLRARLTLIILVPLLTLAVLAGLWQLNNARRTAAEVFDRSLLSAALAVSNDVAISGGDALSPATASLLRDTSGGRVFYHVYAPDGVIVTGYATPPVGIPRPRAEAAQPTFFEAIYRGRTVSGVRLQDRAEVDGFAGVFTTTVWQDRAVRTAFVRDLVLRSFITISALIASLAVIVWFGVRIGLRPLTDLEGAIAERSSDELSPIRRPVPEEVRGVVETLNRLFGQVSRAMTAQSEFLSNAAHQLRNPIAGALSLAEAVQSAPSAEEAKRRAADLVGAMTETAALSQKLLLLERAKAISPAAAHQEVDLDGALQDWAAAARAELPAHVSLELSAPPALGALRGDPTMLREAVLNLVDNAVRHGGAALSRIEITAAATPRDVTLAVRDNGGGIAAADIPRAMERFAQLSPSSSSGLGLSIVEAIAEGHGGALRLSAAEPGLRAELQLPRASS